MRYYWGAVTCSQTVHKNEILVSIVSRKRILRTPVAKPGSYDTPQVTSSRGFITFSSS